MIPILQIFKRKFKKCTSLLRNLLATEKKDPQTINLALESFHGPVSNAADGLEITGFAQDLTDKTLANSAEKLSSSKLINQKSTITKIFL